MNAFVSLPFSAVSPSASAPRSVCAARPPHHPQSFFGGAAFGAPVAWRPAALNAAAAMAPAAPATPAPPATTGGGAAGLRMDVTVIVGENEPIESAIRRFKKDVTKSGHLFELRRRRYFETATEKRIRKAAASKRKARMSRNSNPRPERF